MRLSPRRTEIATARLSAGMLQKEMAERCGVSVGHYQQVELGTRKSGALMERVKRALGK